MAVPPIFFDVLGALLVVGTLGIWVLISLYFLGVVKSLLSVPLGIGFYVFTAVEVLSWLKELNRFWIAFTLLVLLATGVFVVRNLPLRLLAARVSARSREFVSGLSLAFKVSLVGVLGLWAIELFLALYWPPNTNDVLIYHLPRVAHWLQNGTANPYFTNIPMQIQTPPLSGYLATPVLSLTGWDSALNLIQFSCSVLISIMMGVLTYFMIWNRQAALAATAFTASIPLLVAQASTFQNDLLTSLWVSCLALTWILLIRHLISPRIALLSCASFIFLGLQTKDNFLIFALPFIVLTLFDFFFKKRLKYSVALVGLTILIILPSVSLNLNRYSKLKDDMEVVFTSGSLLNTSLNAQALPHNFIKYLVVNLPTPKNIPTARYANSIIASFGIDPDDQSLNCQVFPVCNWELTGGINRHEDAAANPLHFTLLIPLGIWGIVQRRNQALRGYSAAIVTGFLLFLLVTVFGPYQTRYLLPAFPLSSLLVVAFPLRYVPRVLPFAAILSVTYGLLLATNIQYRPLLSSDAWKASRYDKYFWAGNFDRKSNLSLVYGHIRSQARAPRIALDLPRRGGGGSYPEYLHWVTAKHLGLAARFRHQRNIEPRLTDIGLATDFSEITVTCNSESCRNAS